MTEATLKAQAILRDPSQFQWYVIPLLAFVIYVYACEIEKRNWSLVFAGLAFYGMDWLNEIANSLILYFNGHSALWTAPADTAYLIMIGLNIEISFMFAIAGITLAKMLPVDKKMKILGIPNRIFFALTNSIFCVFVEVLLNRADALVWEYSFWNFPNVWLIIVFGYLHFNLVAFWVYDMEKISDKIKVVGAIWGLVAVSLILFLGLLGWI